MKYNIKITLKTPTGGDQFIYYERYCWNDVLVTLDTLEYLFGFTIGSEKILDCKEINIKIEEIKPKIKKYNEKEEGEEADE
jgi:hypothetical protein